MKEAKYWEAREDGLAQCHLCPRHCVIKDGKTGFCGAKKNVGGTLYAHRYGQITALGMDPVEKKPLYHVCPGQMILSVGTYGCSLSCDFCQNHHLWNGRASTEPATPEEIVATARRQGSFGIAYTYNEPYISYEYVLDVARLARDAGLKNVLVTNGYYNEEPFEALLPFIDAMNVDLKSINDDFYQKLCKGQVGPVQRTIERAAKDCLVEITNLIVTDENDSDEGLAALVDYVAGISVDLPIHFSAYRPMFKLTNPATPMERLQKAYELASAKLNYVYLGNVHAQVGSDSRCPSCQATLVKRSGYQTKVVSLEGDQCGECGSAVHFIK